MNRRNLLKGIPALGVMVGVQANQLGAAAETPAPPSILWTRVESNIPVWTDYLPDHYVYWDDGSSLTVRHKGVSSDLSYKITIVTFMTNDECHLSELYMYADEGDAAYHCNKFINSLYPMLGTRNKTYVDWACDGFREEWRSKIVE